MSNKPWKLLFSATADKQLSKLTREIKAKLINYLENRVLQQTDPRCFGKPLRQNLTGFWRYRIEDYRIICELKDNELTVIVVELGHRRDIYE